MDFFKQRFSGGNPAPKHASTTSDDPLKCLRKTPLPSSALKDTAFHCYQRFKCHMRKHV